MRFQYDGARFGSAYSKHFKCNKCSAIFDVVNPLYSGAELSRPPEPELPKASKVRLAFVTGPRASTSVELTKAETLIGRDQCDVATLDPETSRQHALIEVMEDGTVWLQDLGSTNGTFLDGMPIGSKTPIADRQEFTCGKSSFMILID